MVRTLQNIDYEVKRENLYETVAEKLEDSILSGNTQVGERLPSEQALAESFGVSRNVMRESLKLLKERGLIDSRMGGGSYITKPESSDLVNVVNRIILMDNIDYEQVFQMRGILESAACSLAAVKCTQQQVARLEMMNRQLREAAGNQEKAWESMWIFMWKSPGCREIRCWKCSWRLWRIRSVGESPPATISMMGTGTHLCVITTSYRRSASMIRIKRMPLQWTISAIRWITSGNGKG